MPAGVLRRRSCCLARCLRWPDVRNLGCPIRTKPVMRRYGADKARCNAWYRAPDNSEYKLPDNAKYKSQNNALYETLDHAQCKKAPHNSRHNAQRKTQ